MVDCDMADADEVHIPLRFLPFTRSVLGCHIAGVHLDLPVVVWTHYTPGGRVQGGYRALVNGLASADVSGTIVPG